MQKFIVTAQHTWTLLYRRRPYGLTNTNLPSTTCFLCDYPSLHTITWKHRRRYKIMPACFHPITLHSKAICDSRIHVECLHLPLKWTRIAPRCTHSRKSAPLTVKTSPFFIHQESNLTSMSLAFRNSPKNKSRARDLCCASVRPALLFDFRNDFPFSFSILADVKHFNGISRKCPGVYSLPTHKHGDDFFEKRQEGEIKLLFDNGTESSWGSECERIHWFSLTPKKFFRSVVCWGTFSLLFQ